MDKKLITSATQKLKLLDIILHESSLTRNKEIDPLLYPHNLNQESMLGLITRADYYNVKRNDEKKN